MDVEIVCPSCSSLGQQCEVCRCEVHSCGLTPAVLHQLQQFGVSRTPIWPDTSITCSSSAFLAPPGSLQRRTPRASCQQRCPGTKRCSRRWDPASSLMRLRASQDDDFPRYNNVGPIVTLLFLNLLLLNRRLRGIICLLVRKHMFLCFRHASTHTFNILKRDGDGSSIDDGAPVLKSKSTSSGIRSSEYAEFDGVWSRQSLASFDSQDMTLVRNIWVCRALHMVLGG